MTTFRLRYKRFQPDIHGGSFVDRFQEFEAEDTQEAKLKAQILYDSFGGSLSIKDVSLFQVIDWAPKKRVS